MKKNIRLLINILLGILPLVYILLSITKDKLFLRNVSLSVDNPVSIDLLNVSINTKIIEGISQSESIYKISLIPMYVLSILFILSCFFLNKQETEKK